MKTLMYSTFATIIFSNIFLYFPVIGYALICWCVCLDHYGRKEDGNNA